MLLSEIHNFSNLIDRYFTKTIAALSYGSCKIAEAMTLHYSVNNDFKKKNEKKCLPLIPIDKKKDEHVMKISPQLELATFTYLR